MKRVVMILLCTLFLAMSFESSAIASTGQETTIHQAIETTLTEVSLALEESEGAKGER